MSIGLEIEDKNAFLRNEKRYVINTETLPQVKSEWTVDVNHTFGKVDWLPGIMLLVPIASILGVIDQEILSNPKKLYEKIKIHKVANLSLKNYIEDNRYFFEEGKQVPAWWSKETVVFLGTICSKMNDPKRLYVSGLDRQIELIDNDILRQAKVLVYPGWYVSPWEERPKPHEKVDIDDCSNAD